MVDIATVRTKLGLAVSDHHWYDTWASINPREVAFPTADEAKTILIDYIGADLVDAQAAADHRPCPRKHPHLWWVMRRCHQQIIDGLGTPNMIMWPKLPDELGAPGRFAYLYALLAALPDTLALHRKHGVDPEISRATFGNLAEKLRLNRERFGIPGLSVAFWFTLHFKGALYQLGRLEYALETLGDSHPFPGHSAGELTLGVHIPGVGGPLTRRACVESLNQVNDFFTHHFPDLFNSEPLLTCNSWLLDPQLSEYLPSDSNIAQFKQFFELTPASATADQEGRKDVLLFVFNRVGEHDVSTLPRDSRLRRILADGFNNGVNWQVRSGIVRRPIPAE